MQWIYLQIENEMFAFIKINDSLYNWLTECVTIGTVWVSKDHVPQKSIIFIKNTYTSMFWQYKIGH